MKVLVVFVAVALLCLVGVQGHGKMTDPINRASRWRTDPTAPVDYDDNQLYCGGRSVQHSSNGGKCGLCGDDYRDAVPRAHENGGKYGQGVVVKTYEQGSTIKVTVQLTANHKGWFLFSICPLPSKDAFETEECFRNLTLTNGNTIYYVPSSAPGFFDVNLVLPNDLKCDLCVLRWHYNTGNTWGMCEDGVGRPGCGPQENFRSCSDVTIKSRFDNLLAGKLI